ncbi:hypothetical protein CY0110_18302 [Crocosphaera chwakensis CCY0110]|uniref:Uncharacterized protein n=1 Tax=Crocosphaera chwakensis CCY0110 TaxID=391612 RepID=A3IIZ2_9CHRO|nr:hypothetical protein CY0110_18302 [Crocosphaera chwakensis CCY0110]
MLFFCKVMLSNCLKTFILLN